MVNSRSGGGWQHREVHWEACKVLLQLCFGGPIAHEAQACLGGQLLQDVPEHLEVFLCTMHEVQCVEAFPVRLLQKPHTSGSICGLTDCKQRTLLQPCTRA